MKKWCKFIYSHFLWFLFRLHNNFDEIMFMLNSFWECFANNFTHILSNLLWEAIMTLSLVVRTVGLIFVAKQIVNLVKKSFTSYHHFPNTFEGTRKNLIAEWTVDGYDTKLTHFICQVFVLISIYCTPFLHWSLNQ